MRLILAILVLCGTAFPADFLHDTFTGSDGTTVVAHVVDTGGTLTQTRGTSPALLLGNRARSIASASQLYAYSATIPTGDYSAELSAVRFNSDNQVGTGWIDPATNNGYVAWANTGVGYVRLSRSTSGAFETLGTYVIPGGFVPGATFSIKIDVAGDLKTVWLDTGSGYVQRITSSDAVHSGGTQKIALYMAGVGTASSGTLVDWLKGSTPTPPALQSGAASLVAATDASITVEANAAIFGEEPYTYQWHRGTASGFTPTAMNAVAGGTSLFLSDAPGAAGLYFYKLAVTDAASGVAYSNQVTATLHAAPLVVGFIGDSITQDSGGPWTQDLSDRLAVTPLRSVTAVNKGQGGAASGSYPYASAAADFTAAGVTHTVIMLGVNDAKNAVEPATYRSNIAAMVNAEVSAGRTVILAYPTGFTVGGTSGFDEAALQRLTLYFAELDALVNGTIVLAGPQGQFSVFATTPSLLAADGVHLNAEGRKRMASIFHAWFVEGGL